MLVGWEDDGVVSTTTGIGYNKMLTVYRDTDSMLQKFECNG